MSLSLSSSSALPPVTLNDFLPGKQSPLVVPVAQQIATTPLNDYQASELFRTIKKNTPLNEDKKTLSGTKPSILHEKASSQIIKTTEIMCKAGKSKRADSVEQPVKKKRRSDRVAPPSYNVTKLTHQYHPHTTSSQSGASKSGHAPYAENPLLKKKTGKEKNSHALPSAGQGSSTPQKNLAKYHRLKRKFSSYLTKQQPPKKSRRILPLSLTPSVTIETKKAEISEEVVTNHGYFRLQLFALACLALYGTAVSSSENTPSDLNVSNKGARLQGAKGSYGRHAAHADASAGMVDDELANLFARTVVYGLTPMKKQILRVLGLTSEELKQIQSNHEDQDFVFSIFKKIIDRNKDKMYSIIGGTEVEQKMNATDELPSLLNLVCDGGLEDAIRPAIAQIRRKVMLAQLTPEEACQQYCELIHAHFAKTIPAIEEKIQNIKAYWSLTKQINQSKHTATLLKMKKIKALLQTAAPGVPRAQLNLNYKFVTAAKQRKAAKQGNRTITLKWLRSTKKQQIKKYQLLKDYCIWEKAGTKMPDFDYLRHSLTEEMRLNMLRKAGSSPIAFSPASLKYREGILNNASVKARKQLFGNSPTS